MAVQEHTNSTLVSQGCPRTIVILHWFCKVVCRKVVLLHWFDEVVRENMLFLHLFCEVVRELVQLARASRSPLRRRKASLSGERSDWTSKGKKLLQWPAQIQLASGTGRVPRSHRQKKTKWQSCCSGAKQGKAKKKEEGRTRTRPRVACARRSSGYVLHFETRRSSVQT